MILSFLSKFFFVFSAIEASFHVFSGYDDTIKVNLGISTACLAALNSTVDCDKATADMAARGVDDNYWYRENVTSLCTVQCNSSLSSWMTAVTSACSSETLTQGGIVVQAKTITLQYTYGYNLVCLQDRAQKNCLLDSQTWTGSDFIRYDPDMCWQESPPAICNDDGFGIEQISPSMAAITNLYNTSLYCSECFLKLWQQRLLSPFLVPGNWTDYRVDQFKSMQASCSTTIPYSTSAYTLYIGTQNTTTPTPTRSPVISTTIAVSPTCTGQVVKPASTPLSCNQLSDLYNVATGDLRVATSDDSCLISADTCLPLPCALHTITRYSETCESLAAQLSNSSFKVTPAQFFGWNQNIQGSCDDLAIDQRICTSPPGGTWVTNKTINAPSGTTAYHTTATPLTPTQSGSVQACGRYYTVVSGDTCNLICLIYGITFTTLRQLNTYLNPDCQNLWLGYSICVAPVTPIPISKDGLCGPSNADAICPGSGFGDCCSIYGNCGNSSAYCGAGSCYSGKCTASGGGVTTNGTCGPSVGGLTCDNPSFGKCCSIYGFCGDGKDFCGAGKCYSGACDTDIGGPSINGECGPLFAGNKTCTGTQFGKCCSISGYCGSTDDYCKGKNCYSGACS